jgi:hypothetical protein
MQLLIEIFSNSTRTIKGKKKDGTPFEMQKQEGYWHAGKAYPDRFEFTPPRDLPNGYPPGRYEVALESFRINGEYQSFEMDPYNFKLLKLADEPAKVAKVG